MNSVCYRLYSDSVLKCFEKFFEYFENSWAKAQPSPPKVIADGTEKWYWHIPLTLAGGDSPRPLARGSCR